MNRIIKVSMVGCALLMVTACEKNPAESKKQAPQLPPAETMTVDLSMFTKNAALAKAVDTTKSHFTNAALRVGIINIFVVLGLSAPVATFAAAASQQPVLKSDGKFHWIYQVQSGGYTYQADLAGYVQAGEPKIKWEMAITAPTTKPALSDFLWYDGWSNLTNTEGQWHFYDAASPAIHAEVIQLDWSYRGLSDRSATFTNVSANPQATGDILEYRVSGTGCSVSFYDKSEDITAIIAWDSITTAGYLQVPDYNDGEVAYWDENHNNVNP